MISNKNKIQIDMCEVRTKTKRIFILLLLCWKTNYFESPNKFTL